MKIKKNSGFTLIELLVVVAIIGILAGIVIVTVGDAVARARDTRRLADVRQLAFVLERENALGAAASTTGCTIKRSTTTACTGPARIAPYFGAIRDPAAPVGAPACAPGVALPCNYSISLANGAGATAVAGNPRTDKYQICFHLETDIDGAGPLAAGLNRMVTGARLMNLCP